MNHSANRALLLAPLFLSCCVLSAQSNPPATQNPAAQNPAATDSPAQAAKAHDNSFVIGPQDVLDINVWKEADLTKAIPVRSDGKISLPLVGEIQAAGKTPLQLEQDITDKLKSFINDPQVTVIVEQINSQKFNILGEIGKPGTYPLTTSLTIMDAISLAGGLRDFAKKKSIYILRANASGGQDHIPFNYQDFLKGKNIAQNIQLQPRDTIIIP